MKEMRRGSRENGPDSFKSLLFAAGHITQLSFSCSRFSPAHRHVDDFYPFSLTSLRQLAHGAGHDRAVDHDDRIAPSALKKPRVAQHHLFHLRVIDDCHSYNLRMFT